MNTLKRLLILCFLFVPVQLCAEDKQIVETQVIYTGKKTISAKPYYRQIELKQESMDLALVKAKEALAELPVPTEAPTLANYFPFTTRLQVSDPYQKRVSKLLRPIFIIGMDDYSLEWLKEYIDELKDMGAQGIVVQADSYERFKAVQSFAMQKMVSIDLSFGDPLAEAYGIKTYPVLLVGEN